MAIDKLIPCVDFIQQHMKDLGKAGVIYTLVIIENYANFLRQPLTLEMFIGEEALFEGFEYADASWTMGLIEFEDEEHGFIQYRKEDNRFYNSSGEYILFTIEDLIDCISLTLTPKAKQIIYGSNR